MKGILNGVVAAALAAAAAGAAAPRAVPSATTTNGAEAPITIAVFQPEKGGTAIWDGGPAGVKRVRFLKGARLAIVSPSGAGVAYIRYAGDGFDLFHTGVYGGFEAKLAHVAGSRLTALAFSPDSRSIGFASPRGIELSTIVYGRKPRLLPLPQRWSGSSLQGLRFSPDGKEIAFSRTWGDGKAGTLRNELAVIGIDGRNARSLVSNPKPFSAQYRPSFSPDATQMAFALADGSIGVVPSGGGTVRRLTTPRPAGTLRTDVDPLFSPDGTTVAFTRAPGKGGSDVYLVGTDGTALRRLTTTPLPRSPGEPRTGSNALAWAPDATSILAFRHDSFTAVAADGTGETTLAKAGIQYDLSSAVWHTR